MEDIIKDLGFPHSYEVELIRELPSSTSEGSHFYFPTASSSGGRDGILVKVNPPDGHRWLGTFAFGFETPQAVSGIFSCPARDNLCVVSSGTGYIVDTTNPKHWIQVTSQPITDVRLILNLGLLVFVDFTSITTYDARGLAWQAKDISWDGVTMVAVTSLNIEALVWDAPTDERLRVTIDLKNGAIIGREIDKHN